MPLPAASNNVEMAPLAQNAGGFSRSGDPNAILNDCREIDQGIDEIERHLNQLKMLQDRSLNDADTSASSATSRQLDSLSTETMAMYRGLTERVRMIKSNPESRQPKNAAQVGRVDRRLKQAIQNYQQVESAFRKRTQDQMARQYRIVRPDADEQEVRAAVEDTSQGAQVFQQALMQSDRRGQARAVLSAVQDRHAAIQKIEQQMIELAQLFQDMDTLVVQQEEQVQQIEQKGEEVVENLDKGNVELGGAIKSARGARRKKWICLGICGTSLFFSRFPICPSGQCANLDRKLPSSPSSSSSSSSTSRSTRAAAPTSGASRSAVSPGAATSRCPGSTRSPRSSFPACPTKETPTRQSRRSPAVRLSEGFPNGAMSSGRPRTWWETTSSLSRLLGHTLDLRCPTVFQLAGQGRSLLVRSSSGLCCHTSPASGSLRNVQNGAIN